MESPRESKKESTQEMDLMSMYRDMIANGSPADYHDPIWRAELIKVAFKIKKWMSALFPDATLDPEKFKGFLVEMAENITATGTEKKQRVGEEISSISNQAESKMIGKRIVELGEGLVNCEANVDCSVTACQFFHQFLQQGGLPDEVVNVYVEKIIEQLLSIKQEMGMAKMFGAEYARLEDLVQTYESRVGLLASVNNDQDGGGVKVELSEAVETAVFASMLRDSMSEWRKLGKKWVQMKIPIELCSLVEVAVKEGFLYHEVEPTYLILFTWLSGGADPSPSSTTKCQP